MSFDVKSDILSMIAKTDDPAMKTVLLLLLGVFEEIVGKIDAVIANERAMRQMVLNGHEPVHHHHHEWLEKRMKRDDEIEALIDWVETQKTNAETDKGSARKIRDGLIEKLLWALLGGVVWFLIGKM